MSFDLFVYYRALPDDLTLRLQTMLREEGFDLPVRYVNAGQPRIDIGVATEDSDTNHGDGLSIFPEMLAPHRRPPIDRKYLDTHSEIGRRLLLAEAEMHFSNQYCSGENGLKLMVLAAATLAALAVDGIYMDPQEEQGLLLPGDAFGAARIMAQQL